jgi:hypothetical protein
MPSKTYCIFSTYYISVNKRSLCFTDKGVAVKPPRDWFVCGLKEEKTDTKTLLVDVLQRKRKQQYFFEDYKYIYLVHFNRTLLLINLSGVKNKIKYKKKYITRHK